MRDRRLLERLSELPARDELPGLAPAERLMRSVVEHLARLLNTRRGNAAIDPDYGLPDVARASGAGGSEADQWAAMIRQAILRYEPRIPRVEVGVIGPGADQLSLEFELAGEAARDGTVVPFRLRCALMSDGRVALHF